MRTVIVTVMGPPPPATVPRFHVMVVPMTIPALGLAMTTTPEGIVAHRQLSRPFSSNLVRSRPLSIVAPRRERASPRQIRSPHATVPLILCPDSP